ncbi:glycosyltransferase [Mycoplasma sp. 888]|uniref:glycosyltransferase n=1 Tax=Mycoplasma sp. 888 TaxID=3108483 RepID=UPI002D76AE89|nr:glycosyltransferase [Mycoplasma sp. 888]WRQ26059.1 glycosyltransferase [Mycoplasma sp. 888]
MRLSLISLKNNSVEKVREYLERLKDQSAQNFEVILCLTENSKAIFKVAKDYYQFFGNRLIMIFNTKSTSYQHNLISAFRVAKGKFITVLNSDSTFKDSYVENILEQAQRWNVDVLEFKPKLIGSVRFKPKERTEMSQMFDLTKNSLPLAYSFPFIFDKVFKKSLIKKFIKYRPQISNDSIMCIEVTYTLLMNAKKYKYLDYRVKRDFISSDIWLNTQNYVKSFDIIKQIAKNQNLKINEELEYAKYYFLKLLLSGFLKANYFFYKLFNVQDDEVSEKRSSFLNDKHAEIIKKIEDTADFQTFLTTNYYVLLDNDETKLLKTKFSKLKADKLLKGLE